MKVATKGDVPNKVEKESMNGCSSNCPISLDCHKDLEKQISLAKGSVDKQVQGIQNLVGGSNEGELQPMEEFEQAKGKGCGTGYDLEVKDQNEAIHMEVDGDRGSCTS